MKYIKILRALAIALTFTLLAIILPATPAAAQTIDSLTPITGKPGTSVTIVGYNFTGTTVKIYLSKQEPRVGYLLHNEVDAYEWLADTSPFLEGDTTGVIDANFTIPTELSLGDTPDRVRNGTYWVSVTSAARTVKARIQFTVEGAGEITLNPTSGVVGTEVTVSGLSYDNNEDLTVKYDDEEVTIASGDETSDSNGEFDLTILVPGSAAGNHTITVTGADSTTEATAEFTVKPQITLSPTSGSMGTEVTVSGTGFGSRSDIEFVDFAGANIIADIAGASQTGREGDFVFTFIVSAASAASYDLDVEDADGNSAQAEFTIAPAAVSLSPDTGYVGTEVTISGTGFLADTIITITLDGLDIGETTSDTNGNFSTSFNTPAHPTGIYEIAASDGISKSGQDFTISASFSLSQTTGYGGQEITASGSGFQASQTVPIIFDNDLVTTAVADTNGSFMASFNVPPRTVGTYTVTVSDGTDIIKATFTIATNASLSPETSTAAPGYINTELTVNGNGFMVGRTITITYDGTTVATAIVKTDGTFSATFKAPASSGGAHNIIATDGITSWPFTFFMETTPPPTPQPLKPEMDIKAKSEAYFDWEEVTDPSGVTYTLQIATDDSFSEDSIVLEKTGLTKTEYTLTKEEKLESASREAPYYWHIRAVDGASNASQWAGTGAFYVGFTLDLSQSTIYVIFSIGALLLGIFGFWLGRKTAYF